MARRNHIEDDHARAFWAWAQHLPVLRDHLYHVPNEGKRGAKAGGRMKGMGLRAGVHDYHLPVPRGTWHGLWIELKPPKGVSSRVTPEQKEWKARMRAQGFAAFVCYGWPAAAEAAKWYLGLPVPEIQEFNEDPKLEGVA